MSLTTPVGTVFLVLGRVGTSLDSFLPFLLCLGMRLEGQAEGREHGGPHEAIPFLQHPDLLVAGRGEEVIHEGEDGGEFRNEVLWSGCGHVG